MSLNWLVAELLASAGPGGEMGPEEPPARTHGSRGNPQGDACGVRSFVVASCCEEVRLCQKGRIQEEVLGEEPDPDPGRETLKRLLC